MRQSLAGLTKSVIVGHMTVTTNEEVAAKVRGAAAEKRISNASLAAALNMSPMAMSRRISGSTPFSPAELIRIAATLGVPVATFFGERAVQEVAA